MIATAEASHTTSESQHAYFEASLDLLRAMADVLDIRTVLPRVSEIVREVLPHDAVAMVFLDLNGQLVVEASTEDFPAMKPQLPMPDDFIIRDLTSQALPAAAGVSSTERLVATGYRSVLSVPARTGRQGAAVAFWSKQPAAFAREDLPLARRIAGHLALSVAHEQLARAAREAAKDHSRSERLEARVQMVCDDLQVKTHQPVVGQSPEWRDVLRKATQVAATEATVLLTGESGVGKEVVARFIHRASARRNGPFIALNCAAIPEQLLESELFGHERGAFTSAQQAKPGLIEMASGGVLFLDEVSEMSPSAQAKFLRVLQEREFQRLGATRPIKANVRIVAATNRDLRKAVEDGEFRNDLFYRLLVFDIHIAPLRERRADIVPLAEAFLQEIAQHLGRHPVGLSSDARKALLQHDWPGNIRELRNALERAAILCEGDLIDASHLSLHARTPARSDTNLKVFERDAIAKVLRDCGWNKSAAAVRLGLTRTQLYTRMRRYGLDDAAVA